jgi:hypothetical protein
MKKQIKRLADNTAIRKGMYVHTIDKVNDMFAGTEQQTLRIKLAYEKDGMSHSGLLVGEDDCYTNELLWYKVTSLRKATENEIKIYKKEHEKAN